MLGRTVIAPLIALSTIGIAAAQDSPAAGVQTPPRPRIALVLGGGGARGAAHIGVLKVLEELRVPVDCVAGTSMGALIGAAYATGMDRAQIEKLVTGIDWGRTFGTAAVRDLQPVRVKAMNANYSNTLEFGINKKGFSAPGGLVTSQAIDEILRTIVSNARYQDSFDDLPIPYRAVATDVATGEMMVLDGGDLAAAMRASMAVPGAFAPVRVDDRVLVDGGLVRNLPVDIGRQMCGDVVIASSLASPKVNPDDLQSVFAVLGQTVDIMIKNNERAQLATLKDTDVPVIVPIEGMSSSDFDKVPLAIPMGERAARAVSASLARYSLSPEAYAAWRASVARAAPESPPVLADVRIDGLDRVNPKAVRQVVKTPIGQPIDQASVIADADRIFAMGDFESVDYNVESTPGGPVLVFQPKEKPWGPDYLRFDLGLMSATGGDTGFVLRADHMRSWVNSRGARWYNTLQLGRTVLLETSLVQPIDLKQVFYVVPALKVERDLQDLFDGNDRVARYERTMLEARLDFGASLGRVGELRVGLRQARTDYKVDTGDLLQPEFDNVDTVGFTSRLTFDSRDSSFVPTRGSYARINYYSAEPSMGSDDEYQRAELFAQHVFPFKGNLIYIEASGGTDFDGDAPGYDLFTLGGLHQLGGLQDQELRGHEYAFGRVVYLRKLTDIQVLKNQALYAGISLEAGKMSDRIDGSPDGDTILGSTLFFGGRTPLGPLTLAFGYAEDGDKAAYIQIGRPLRER